MYSRKKLIPQEFFPACIGFVPGGMSGIKLYKFWRIFRGCWIFLEELSGHFSPKTEKNSGD